jgi:hypothetical protein
MRPADTGSSPPFGAAGNRPAADNEEQLYMHLERDQFVSETSRPVTRAILPRRTTAALWALRAAAVVLSGMVVYTFVAQLH